MTPPSSGKNTDKFLLDSTVFYSPEESNIRATYHFIKQNDLTFNILQLTYVVFRDPVRTAQ